MALTLTAALNDADQAFLLSGTSPTPTPGDLLQIDAEVVFLVNAGPHDSGWRVETTRGYNTTTPATHAQGATAYQVRAPVQTSALASTPPSEVAVELGLTATSTELNALATALAGVAVASKAAIYDAAGKLAVSSASPAAAGSASQAGSTGLTAQRNYVTGANHSAGVRLPVPVLDAAVTVINSVVTAGDYLNVYPSTGTQINALGANVAFALNPGQTATFIARSTSLWNVAAAADTISGLTASAAELNLLDDAVAGTAVASKALALGADKNVDTLAVADGGLKLGAAAGTAVTSTAAELNLLDGATAPPVQVAERTFTETGDSGTYTATVVIPAGATVLDVIWRNTALWTATASASLVVGDDDDPNGYIEATDVKSAPIADTSGAGAGFSSRLSLGATIGAYQGGAGKFCATSKTITATVTTVDVVTGTAGRSRLLVEYALPSVAAAVKA